jgi:drug/metabolite transporter (DMT)-like permease
VAEAGVVQPFAYFQLIFASLIGVFVFGESLAWNITVGCTIVVGAGLFTLWRERVAAQRRAAIQP